jgi:hypothetical protein
VGISQYAYFSQLSIVTSRRVGSFQTKLGGKL